MIAKYIILCYTKLMQRSPYYPFPPRPGEYMESLSLDWESNALVDPEIQAAIIDFEHNLYDLTLPVHLYPQAAAYLRRQRPQPDLEQGETQDHVLSHPAEDAQDFKHTVEPFETVWSKKILSIDLGAEYFLTDEGKASWHHATGNTLVGTTVEAITKELSSQGIATLPSTVLDALEAESIGYAEKTACDQFTDGHLQGTAITTPSFVTLFKNPEIIVEKVKGYQELKEYLIALKKDIQASTDVEAQKDGELLVIDLYRKRLNTFLAAGYIEAYKALWQYHASGELIHEDVVTELEEILPAFVTAPDQDRSARLLQRIDRYRHGVSVEADPDDSTDTHYTWKSPLAIDLMDRAANVHRDEEEVIKRELYGDIEASELEGTMISSDLHGDWIRSVLDEYGLLSVHTDWDSERVGPADDELWQVIVNNKFKSLSVNDKQRIVCVPDKAVSIERAISLINHEIVHVLQHTNKRAIGRLAIMQKIGLDNVSEQTESGGKWQEKVANEASTGKVNPRIPGTGYFKALEVKSRGGSYGEIVQAYFDELRVTTPRKPLDKAVAESVNRARRLFRSGGFQYAPHSPYVTNSQPLSYLEQQLIYESLDDEQRRVLFIGGVTIRNLVRLSEAGLVDMSQVSVPETMPYELLHDKAKEVINATTTH